ncbi:unnamed protein product [Orchesella dallaii]|uniref:Reverse transcriptase domain-containing protein n=1 Tax=Orchesella dallaii TaxID=48710 RepID=A0ABP1RJA6_9HEXA
MKTEIIETATSVEQFLSMSTLKDGIKHEIRRDTKLALEKHSRQQKPSKLNKYTKTIKALKNDPSIVILQADKGNQTVIMNKSEYDDKMDTLVKEGDYVKVSRNPTSGFEKKAKTLLKQLLNSKAIEQNEHDFLNPNHTHTPILYGRPKTHKEGMPMRPVVDYRRTPFYKLSKYATSIINTCGRDNKYSVKNSAEFVNKIKQLELPDDYKLVSFDVKSLFTSIPVQDALGIIREDLQQDLRWKSSFKGTLDELMMILDLCLNTSFFVFRSCYYLQKSGCPMGSPLSPIIAEFYMRRLEMTIVPHIEDISFWARFVDDILAIIKEGMEIVIRDILESFHPAIKFTHELEENNQLPFLDSLIYRTENNKIGHRTYRKPSHTEVYLNYFSNHHYSHKISVIHALYIRAFRVCDEFSLEEELTHVTSILMKNNYPAWLLKKEKSKLYTTFVRNNYIWPEKPATTSQAQDFEIEIEYVCLPFTRNTSETIAQSIKRHTFGSTIEVKIAFSPGPKLNSIFNSHKDKFPLTCGIYEAKCLSCIAVYVGETGQLKLRTYQHLNAIRNDDPLRSATVVHIQETNYTHQIDASSFRLIRKEERKWKRKFMESLYIRKYEEFFPLMNQEEGMQLDPVWPPFLKNFI